MRPSMYWLSSKAWLGFILLFITGISQAQSTDEWLVRANAETLRTALLSRDTVQINQLLHSKASFGHSNGWVQSRAECTSDLYSGKLRYDSLRVLDSGMVIIEKKVAIYRQQLMVAGLVKTTPFRMKLHVQQTWVKKGNNWLLLARQSAKLPD